MWEYYTEIRCPFHGPCPLPIGKEITRMKTCKCAKDIFQFELLLIITMFASGISHTEKQCHNSLSYVNQNVVYGIKNKVWRWLEWYFIWV